MKSIFFKQISLSFNRLPEFVKKHKIDAVDFLFLYLIFNSFTALDIIVFKLKSHEYGIVVPLIKCVISFITGIFLITNKRISQRVLKIWSSFLYIKIAFNSIILILTPINRLLAFSGSSDVFLPQFSVLKCLIKTVEYCMICFLINRILDEKESSRIKSKGQSVG